MFMIHTVQHTQKKAAAILVLGMTFSVSALRAQNVGINTTGAAGHASAMLDVSASDRGVLFPNVTLTGATDAVTIASPAKGLMLWNTGTAWGTAGYYYNDGSSGSPNWVKMASNVATLTGGTGINISAGTVSNTGVLSLTGTANQVNVSASTGSVTLSTPQNIHTGASPTFAGATLTGLTPAGIVTNTAGGVLGTSSVASLMADLTPGAGLTGTVIYDGSSAQTFAVASGNGLTTDAAQDRVKLGGLLDENTSIAKGAFHLTLNQTGTGDFDIQDNGASSFFVYGNDGAATDGNVGIGTNTPASRLQVMGSVFIPDGQSYWIGNNTDAGERLRMHHSGINSYVDYASGDLVFRANTTAKVVFQSGGDVQVNNLAGTGNRLVTADANGVLNTKENSMWTMSANFGSSPDDLSGGDISADGADDAVYVRNLGFTIVINGVSYTQVSVCTNGWIAFGNVSANSYAAEPLPSGLFTTPVIFPYWTDLKDFGTGEWIREYPMNNNVYVLEWRMRAYTSGSTNWVVRFQVQIHKSGLINVKYYDPMQPQMNGQQHTIDGTTRNTTIGFQLDGGTNARFHQISYNAKVLDDNNEISEGWSVSPVR